MTSHDQTVIIKGEEESVLCPFCEKNTDVLVRRMEDGGVELSCLGCGLTAHVASDYVKYVQEKMVRRDWLHDSSA